MGKNWFKTIMTIIVVFLFFIFLFEPYIGDIENWFNEHKYYNIAREIASERLKGMQFGEDAAVSKLITLKSKAENWNFSGQEGFSLIKTGDPNVPFVTSALFIFTDPNNKNHQHILRDTYIFDYNYYAWVPLTSDLTEFSEGKLKLISRYVIWQGDYEIPFFK